MLVGTSCRWVTMKTKLCTVDFRWSLRVLWALDVGASGLLNQYILEVFTWWLKQCRSAIRWVTLGGTEDSPRWPSLLISSMPTLHRHDVPNKAIASVTWLGNFSSQQPEQLKSLHWTVLLTWQEFPKISCCTQHSSLKFKCHFLPHTQSCMAWSLPTHAESPTDLMDLVVVSPVCLGWEWRWKWACGRHTLLSSPWMPCSPLFIQSTSSCHSDQLKCCPREVLAEFLIQCTYPIVPGNVDFTHKALTALFFSCGCWLMFLYPGLSLSEL